MRLDIKVRQDCGSRFVSQRFDVGFAKFGGDAVVGEEQWESVPLLDILKAA
jgi:hypothetical protein